MTPKLEADFILGKVADMGDSYIHSCQNKVGSVRAALSNLCKEKGVKLITSVVGGTKIKVNLSKESSYVANKQFQPNQLILNQHDIEIMAALAILIRHGITSTVEIVGLSSRELDILYPQVADKFQKTDTEKGVLLL